MGVKKLLINQFNVDISEYLDYNPKQDINIESFEKNLDNLDPEDKKEAEIILEDTPTEIVEDKPEKESHFINLK